MRFEQHLTVCVDLLPEAGSSPPLDTSLSHFYQPSIFTECLPKILPHVTVVGKGKGHPRTGHESPEGEQMYSSTLPSTLALDGGGWSTTRPGRFTPRKDPVPIV